MKNKSVIILCVLLFLCVSFIGYVEYNASQSSKMEEVANLGYNYAMENLAKEVVKCEPIPFGIGNQTVNLIALECLPKE
jgi:hypothetical protein